MDEWKIKPDPTPLEFFAFPLGIKYLVPDTTFLVPPLLWFQTMPGVDRISYTAQIRRHALNQPSYFSNYNFFRKLQKAPTFLF